MKIGENGEERKAMVDKKSEKMEKRKAKEMREKKTVNFIFRRTVKSEMYKGILFELNE